MLKLQDVTPVYVQAVEQTPVISSVQKMSIKKNNVKQYNFVFA